MTVCKMIDDSKNEIFSLKTHRELFSSCSDPCERETGKSEIRFGIRNDYGLGFILINASHH